MWPDGKKRPRNVYAPTEEECEEKLAELIRDMNGEIAALRTGESTDYPEDVNPKKKAIADYLREMKIPIGLQEDVVSAVRELIVDPKSNGTTRGNSGGCLMLMSLSRSMLRCCCSSRSYAKGLSGRRRERKRGISGKVHGNAHFRRRVSATAA